MITSRFTERVAIVTGGANGIGEATVRRFVDEGARVVIADVDAVAGNALAAQLGDRVRFVQADISTESAWTDLVEAALGFGRLDVVHLNAFALKVMPADKMDLTEWNRQIGVCLTQVYLAVHACVPVMQPGGAFVCTSSVHAHAGFPGHPAYAAAKGGICALVRQLSVEYGPAIRFNTVIPGSIDTQVWDGAAAAVRHEVSERAALRRMGRPEEVAAAVAFLASDDASFITGAELVVDGGWLVSPLSPTART